MSAAESSRRFWADGIGSTLRLVALVWGVEATIRTNGSGPMTVFSDIAVATWEVYLLASPFILLGFVMAGLVHVLVPQ